MRMRRLGVVVVVTLVAFVSFNLIASATAQAQTTRTAQAQTARMDDCVHQPTIDMLEACVDHCADQGFITNHWVTWSLLFKLESAENSLRRGHTSRAINTLNAFISEVRAQSSKHIIPLHAMHLMMHAQLVIHALENR